MKIQTVLLSVLFALLGIACGAAEYLVVDLTGFGVTKVEAEDAATFNTDAFKTEKLVLRRVVAGSCRAGSPTNEVGRESYPWLNRETLRYIGVSRDFYIGVFPVTQAQYAKVMGGANPSAFKGNPDAATSPVDSVSYKMIRGAEKGCAVPVTDEVDAHSFLGTLRAKTGGKIAFDLPTDAQWEYAARAYSKGPRYFSRNPADELQTLARHAWTKENAGGRTHGVGQKLPNRWGLYDLFGNVWEICRDRVKPAPNDDPAAIGEIDRIASVPNGNTTARGGAWLVDAANARASSRVGASTVDRAFKTYGFRLYAPTEHPANDGYDWKLVDFSGAKDHHVIVAAGTPTEYQGHPTTALMADGKTVYCTWPTGHGGYAGKLAVSHDAGLTWTRCDERLPRGAEKNIECPLLHRLTGPDGRERLWIWSGYRAGMKRAKGGADALSAGAMPSLLSEDGGQTWREMPPLGEKFRCVLSFQAVLRRKDGSYLGIYHRGPVGCADAPPLELVSSVTRDGGFTWSEPRVIAKSDDLDFCEPWMFRSPDGKEICCLIRENHNSDPAQVIFSRDDGETWTKPRALPHVLAGHRHQGVVLPDGRILVCMRDAAVVEKTKTNGHLVCWIGSYETIRTGSPQPGDYRVKLLHSYAGWDCGYPGVHLLPDGTVLVTTYIKYRPGKDLNSIVSVRFRVGETDRLSGFAASR